MLDELRRDQRLGDATASGRPGRPARRARPSSLAARLDGRQLDRFEQAGDGFHQRVLDGFRAMAAADPERWIVVATDGAAPTTVGHRVRAAVRERLAVRPTSIEHGLGRRRRPAAPWPTCAAAAAHPVHAYLFVGPPGSTKDEAARAFAASCSPGVDDPDAATPASPLAGEHPDVREVERVGAGDLGRAGRARSSARRRWPRSRASAR